MSKLIINVDDLTIGDLEAIEEIAEAPAGQVFTNDFSAAVLKALIFVTQRRENPDFSLEDAAKVRFGEIDIVDDDELKRQGDPVPS